MVLSQMLRSLVLPCLASLAIYFTAFAMVLDRPVSNGALSRQIEAKIARGSAITGKKLVILAGSNGPYSHRCETIEPIVGRPCINGGVAVGIGLDYLFLRWERLLRPGDVVYLPMEPTQYSRRRLENTLGADAAILFHGDWRSLAALPPDRWLGAAFSGDFRAVLMSGIEQAAAALRRGNFDRQADIDAWGDRIGHVASLGIGIVRLRALQPLSPTVRQISDGYGSGLIAGFSDRMTARGVIVIGGLSTGFSDVDISAAQIAAMRGPYVGHGGRFLMLDNRSRYDRENFFDSDAHLNEPAQIAHSRRIAAALLAMLPAADGAQLLAKASSADSLVPP